MLHKFFPIIIDIEKEQVKEQVREQVRIETRILEYCTVERTFNDILEQFGYKGKRHFRERYLNPLIEKGLIGLTNPNSKHSPTQKYYTILEKL